MKLPVHEAIAPLREALQKGSAVLIAPPGAGKTTVVPLETLNEPWLKGRSILMLEPRRLAARGAAARMADLLGEQTGQTVGYRIRFDHKVSKQTRIEVVTEGILSRRIQNDPELSGVGLVIFDEFHERSIHADLGLALALDVQSGLRPDLRILVMSATLDGERVSEFLSAPLVRAEGRSFPVEVRYAGLRKTSPAQAVADAAIDLLQKSEGDILAFLPGSGDIRRALEILEEKIEGAIVCPLFGDLSQADQDRAVFPDRAGRRKIILATNIAETSLTIEGVRAVIDTGLEKRLVLDPRTGLSALETVRISRASAEQRAGRAGRLAPGVCVRLYDEEEFRRMQAHAKPEILEADLSPLLLELAAWGSSELRFLDPPPTAHVQSSRALLRLLGALDDAGAITETGRRMNLPLHPRLSRMILEARNERELDAACDLAAVLSERDILRGSGADLRERLRAMADARDGVFAQASHRGSLTRALKIAREMRRLAPQIDRASDAEGGGFQPGRLLAAAYPDRIARARDEKMERYLLSNGRGARLEGTDPVRSEFLVAAETRGSGADSIIDLALPVTLTELRTFTHLITFAEEKGLDQSGRGVARRVERFLSLEIAAEETLAEGGDAVLASVVARGITRHPSWKSTEGLRLRVEFLRRQGEDLPDFSDACLERTASEWLSPYVSVMRSLAEADRLDLGEVLSAMLSHGQRQTLRDEAPEKIRVPSGSEIQVDYSGHEPSVSVKLQELFGLTETPRIARGRCALTLQLLSPGQRPIQVTKDLAGFWKRTYAEVRKELRGRYPKHPWPEDPMTAVPTRFTKKRQEREAR